MGIQVIVERTDLLSLAVDAIVNPTNSLCVMNAGIPGAIRRTGGAIIEQQAQTKAPLAVGAAYVTQGGKLTAKHVIHAPIVAEPGHRVITENVRRAARVSLLAADAHKLKSIGLPAIGVDTGEVAPEEATRAIVEEIRAHKRPYPELVILATNDIYVGQAFEEALRNAQQAV